MQQIKTIVSPDALKDSVVSVKYIIGYRGDFRNNILQHSESNKFIYPAANSIIVYNSENKQQNILPTLQGSRGVTCMTISPTRRYIAWAEECDTGIIIIYDTQTGKRKTLQTMDCKSRYYVSLDFSRNPHEESKYLVALSGPPDQILIHWAWDKPKCLGSTQVNNKITGDNIRFTNVFFHPKEDDFVCVMGNGAIKPYKLIADNPPKQKDSPFVKKEIKDSQHSSNYLSYCILNDGKTMIVGTDQGELLYFNENCEFKTLLPTSPFEGFSCEAICKYQNGFLVGGPDFTIYIYRKHEGDLKNPYVRVEKKITNKDFKFRVTSLLLSLQEESLIIGVDNGQILQVPFSADREGIVDEQSKFDYLVMPFHTEPITGIDVCIRKPLVATCSTDRTLRLWNYIEPQLEIIKEFDDELWAVAFHPSGFHMIAAFGEKILMLNIFENDFQPFKDIHIKGCKEIKFSNGGHLFAIANSNIVQVYNFYTGENPPNFLFRGHSGKIKSIVWDTDDLGFYTGGSDGLVIYWRLEDSQNKTIIFNQPGLNIETIAISSYESSVYVSGTQNVSSAGEQKCIWEVKFTVKKERDLDNTKKIVPFEPFKIVTNSTISKMQLTYSEKLFFLTTSDKDNGGALRICKYPFTNEVVEIQSHYQGVNKLLVTFDDSYLLTVGNDGAIVIYTLNEELFKVKLDKDGMGHQFADEFLIPKEKYKKKILKIDKLRQDFTELNLKQEMKLHLHLKDRDEKIRELEESIDTLMKTEKEKYETLMDSKKKAEAHFDEQKRIMKATHEATKKQTETEFKQKIQLEQQRFEDLTKEKEKELDKFTKFVEFFEQNNQATMLQKQSEYDAQLKQEKDMYEQLHNQKEELKRNFTKQRNQLEDEAEVDIDKLKEENDSSMKKLYDDLDKAESEKRAKKTQYETESQKLEEQHSKLKEILEDIQQIQEANKQLSKERESHAKEIEERDKTIRDKGRRIYELKKKTQELEKFKFVLDYKIKELKRDIGPREEEIAKMKEQIANMNTEILHFKRTNANLSLIVTDLNLRQQGMKREIENQQGTINTNNQYMKAFEYDISEAYTSTGDFKRLKANLLKLFNKYVQNESTKKKKFENIDFQKEFIKERAHLETTVKGLKDKFEKNLRVHEQDNNRIMIQNVDLISEINDLKREKKNLRDEIKRKIAVSKEKIQENESDQINEQALDREIENNDEEIEILKNRINQIQDKIANLRDQVQLNGDDLQYK